MALLRPGLHSRLNAGFEPNQHSYFQTRGQVAVPHQSHPGKFLVESSPEVSSHSSGETHSGKEGHHDKEPSSTPFSLPAAQERLRGGPWHTAAPGASSWESQGLLGLEAAGRGGLPGSQPGGAGRGAGEGIEGDGGGLRVVRGGGPYPHRWLSRRRRRCRSLGYLALHAPTLEEEQGPRIRPSSASPPPAAVAAGGFLAASRELHGAHPAAPAGGAGVGAVAKRAAGEGHSPPAPPLQRGASGSLAGAPRALQSKQQQHSVGGGQVHKGSTGQHVAKKARTSAGSGAAPSGMKAGKGAQGGRAAAVRKPPGKPPSKPPKPSLSPRPPPQPPSRSPLPVAPASRSMGGRFTPAQGGPPFTQEHLPASGGQPPYLQPGTNGVGGREGGSAPYASYPAAVGGPQDYPPGQLVWAKMPTFPWWPGQVQSPQLEHLGIKHGASDVFVVFYGTADFNWVPRKDVKPFSHTLPDYSKHSSLKNKALQRAIDEAWVALGRVRPDVYGRPHDGG